MSNLESKPLSKQSYQTVPDITMSDDEKLFTNNTERVADSYKRNYGYAVLTSGILFVLLMASAAFNNKNGDKSFASRLKLSHVVPMEGSSECLMQVEGHEGLESGWRVEKVDENVNHVFYYNKFRGSSDSKTGTCKRLDIRSYYVSEVVGTLNVLGETDVVLDDYEYQFFVNAHSDGYTEVFVDGVLAGWSDGCKPIDLFCAIMASDAFDLY